MKLHVFALANCLSQSRYRSARHLFVISGPHRGWTRAALQSTTELCLLTVPTQTPLGSDPSRKLEISASLCCARGGQTIRCAPATVSAQVSAAVSPLNPFLTGSTLHQVSRTLLLFGLSTVCFSISLLPSLLLLFTLFSTIDSHFQVFCRIKAHPLVVICSNWGGLLSGNAV